MRHARLATYDLVKGTFPELVGLAEKGILPVFAKEDGFVDYGLIDTGNGKFTSISIWQTLEQAQKAGTVAQTWVQANMADRIRLMTNTVGEVGMFHGAPVAA